MNTDPALVERRLDDWRRRLIDLSHRNRLISYRPTRATTLTIAQPSLAELLSAPEAARSWSFYFPSEPVDDGGEASISAADAVDALAVEAQSSSTRRKRDEIEVTEPHPQRIARILDNLAKRSNAELQDKALRILYVAAGFLDWRDGERDVTSPLVLVPVELQRSSPRHPYRLSFVEDEDIVINPSLTEKLRRDAGLEVPADWAWEDKPIEQELDEVRAAIAGTNWTVRDTGVIGLFSFQKYVMYRDLLDHQDRVAAHPVVRSLAQGTLVSDLLDAAPEAPAPQDLDEQQLVSETLSVLDADASQRCCIESAKQGRSFVMQGPPGTGKSQTIANMISEAIGQGKRVLFVSEKAAALDVVHRRLTASGLDEYCLMLHGEHAARREVVEALHRSLTSSLAPGRRPSGEDLERLATLRTLLNDSAELLHLPQEALGGRTLREVHEQLAALHDAPSIPGSPEPAANAGADVMDSYHRLNEIFQRLAQQWYVSPADFLWRGYSGTRFTEEDHGRVLRTIKTVRSAIGSVAGVSATTADSLALTRPTTIEQAEGLADVAKHLERAPVVERSWLDEPPDLLREAAADAEATYAAAGDASTAFIAEYPEQRAASFDPGAGAALSEALDAVKTTCGWGPGWGERLQEAATLADSIDSLRAAIREVQAREAALADRLGQPAAARGNDALEGLAELAALAFGAEHRPERVWLVRAGLERAERAFAEVRDQLVEFQSTRAELFASYAPEVLELDAATMRHRFEHDYTSALSRLSSGYRRDARALKACREDGKLPADIIADLEAIEGARRLRSSIEERRPKLEQALGAYAADTETDCDAVEDALRIARRAIELSAADADIERLAEALCVPAVPDAALAQLADQLHSGLARVQADLEPVQPFVEVPADLSAQRLDRLDGLISRLRAAALPLLDQVRTLQRGSAQPATRISTVIRRAEVIDQAHRARTTLQAGEPAWRERLGSSFDGPRTSWQAIREAAGWLEALAALVGERLPPQLREEIGGEGSGVEASGLEEACATARSAIESLAGRFDAAQGRSLAAVLLGSAFPVTIERCDAMAERVDELRDWTQWRGWHARAVSEGWGEFVDELVAADVPDEGVLPSFQRAYWNRRLEAFYDEDPELAEDLRGGAFQRWVDEFCELDADLVRTGADRLIARRESTRTRHVAAQGSEVDLLRREAMKARRHLPVRSLLERIPSLLSDLKPCLMMSPLTVSHFLAPDSHFDLVIFDEASQVPPQDAVNCIYRGDQLIVAGDSNQLPPTPFFQIAELDELDPEQEDERTQEDMESVLDACSALLPDHSLRWHYRSRSESLIAFSNDHIYKGDLVTFPSALATQDRAGVGFHYVADGVYDRGRSACNRREAAAVARRVLHYLTDGSDRSLGVIAFNSAQANAITEELDLLRAERPDLDERFAGDRLDAVFVKHLEAVQGDERDVILLSVGYARDGSGRFSMNFGPLNKEGGSRRLNVAITRARERLEVVASVRAREFTLSETSSRGSRMLRDYIAYAEGGPSTAPAIEGSEGTAWPSPLEEQVAAELERLGYAVEANVGVGAFRIDLGARRPGGDGYVMGIECDGATYVETPTARDRERLRHEVLADLGWGAIHRVWSLDWVANRLGEVERLQAALAAAEDANGGDTETTQSGPRDTASVDARTRIDLPVAELSDPESVALLPWATVYERAELGSAHSLYDFHETVNRERQTDMLVELLEVEAPVSIDYAIGRLAAAWGLRRTGHRVISAGRQSVGQAVHRGAVEIRGEFLWGPGQELTLVRVPDSDHPDSRRSIGEIPPEEIDLAVDHLRRSAGSLTGDQLVAQVARVFGFDRTGDRIRTAIEERVGPR